MEILNAVETIAREKGLDQEEMIDVMEEAVQKAARAKYGQENDIRAVINRSNGIITLYRYTEVVEKTEDIENEAQQITLEDALKLDKDAKVGDFLKDELPPLDFGRVAAQTAKQVITQRVRDAERERQFNDYQHRVGEVINGTVKRADYGNVVVDLGNAEAVIRRDEGIPRERLKAGDRVRAYIMDVRRELRGPQIFLSRSHPEFMAKLFMQEVPEIYDGIIEIRAVARDPGSRAKITVYSHDPSIDPVGSCVGMRGSRVQAVVNELQGEKVDIIPWTDDLAALVVTAMQPAQISKVVLDEEGKKIEIVVAEDQLSLAIGRRGQNVRLASKLVGWDIDILTDEQEAERRAEETSKRVAMFMHALDVDDVIAHLLVTEGFIALEDVAYIDLQELTSIQGFDADIAEELQNRAKDFVEKQEAERAEKFAKLGVQQELIDHPFLDSEMVLNLAENDVKSLDDLGDLATDELVEIVGAHRMRSEVAQEIIMAIRETWFDDEETDAEEAPEATNKETAA